MIRNAMLSLFAMVSASALLYAQAPAVQPLPGLPAPAPQPSAPNAPAPAATPSPTIQFETPIYDFGRMKSGDPVKYSYIFTNTAPVGCGAILEVTHVQPSCGCTTAGDWTRKVEPGKTGTIPIQFNTANYNGGVLKQITVTCNDSAHPNVVLQLKGTVWKLIDIAPPYSGITLGPDATSGSTSVRITSNMEEPINLSQPESNNRQVTGVLTTNRPGKDFQVLLSTVPPLNPGTFTAEISIKTDSTNMPVIKVPVWVNIQPVINLTPPSPTPVVVPPGPLPNKTAQSIRIQNNSTNTMRLSEAAIDMPGIEVEIRELQPGRIFDAQLTFPEGFQLEPGKQLAFTAKSSLAQYPLIKVPVIQAPRPAPNIKVMPPPLPGGQPPPAPIINRPGFPPRPAPPAAPAAAPTTSASQAGAH
jgi:hypothetical protein